MSDSKQRDAAESLFARNQRRETEIDGALMQEAARHAAVIKNMHRLQKIQLIVSVNPDWQDLSEAWNQPTRPFEESHLRPPTKFQF